MNNAIATCRNFRQFHKEEKPSVIADFATTRSPLATNCSQLKMGAKESQLVSDTTQLIIAEGELICGTGDEKIRNFRNFQKKKKP